MNDKNTQKIKEHLPYLLSLLVLTLLPRIYFATPYLFDGDPVNYYLGAKNLLEGNGYIAMGVPVIWPVGYSLSMIPFLIICITASRMKSNHTNGDKRLTD